LCYLLLLQREHQAGETTNPSDQQPKKLSLYCML